MKALRYLLIAMVMVLASASIQAQVKQSEKAEHQFHSTLVPVKGSSTSSVIGNRTTSTLMGDGSISLMNSGSRLPIAARNGVVVSGSVPGDDTPINGTGHPGRPRRTVGDDGFEDDDDPENMDEPFPIGDGMWVLAILAAAYAAYIARNRVRAMRVREEA